MLRHLRQDLPTTAAWVLMIVLLPITSMPLVARLVGSEAVAAPSGILLLVLVLAWLVPHTLRRGCLPGQSLPLLGFALVAVLATALASFLPLPPYKDISPLRSQAEGLVTVGIGLCFYLVAAAWPNTEGRLAGTLRLINWSGLMILLWSAAQALAWYTGHRYPEWMRDFHDLYSLGPLYRQRVTGFAVEPSWLAHQLNLLYLPLWLASSVRGFTAHRFRLGRLTFENLLLAGGVAALLLTLSRIGMLAFLLMVAFLVIPLNVRLARWLRDRMLHRWPGVRPRLAMATILILLIIAYLAVLAGVGLVLARVDPQRMSGLLNFSLGTDNPVMRYANQLLFASRLVYWQAGWGVFNEHPFLGVGLGNAGYYFPKTLSAYSWSLFEVRQLVFRSPNLLNIKSFWVRLLAETGVVGFAFFTAWFYLLWQSARSLARSHRPLLGMLAVAGPLALLAFLIEGFSVDTFAFPYLWISAGLLTAAVGVHESTVVDRN